MATMNWNQWFICAIYAWTEDPDYLVFDADLWEGCHVALTDPSEYSAVVLVELSPGRVELVLDPSDSAYRLATDTGRYNALQVVWGDAGAAARIVGLSHDQDHGEDEDDDTEEEVVSEWSDEQPDAPPLVGEVKESLYPGSFSEEELGGLEPVSRPGFRIRPGLSFCAPPTLSRANPRLDSLAVP